MGVEGNTARATLSWLVVEDTLGMMDSCTVSPLPLFLPDSASEEGLVETGEERFNMTGVHGNIEITGSISHPRIPT